MFPILFFFPALFLVPSALIFHLFLISLTLFFQLFLSFMVGLELTPAVLIPVGTIDAILLVAV
jgi:hypothetical protein